MFFFHFYISILIFIKSSILIPMVLYFYHRLSFSTPKDINLLFLSLSPSLTVKFSTYPLIVGNINTNGLITLSKYPTKYLESFFVLTNFEMTILLTSTSQIFIVFFCTIKFFFFFFCLTKCQHCNTMKKVFANIFYLIDMNIFLRIYYSSSEFDLY